MMSLRRALPVFGLFVGGLSVGCGARRAAPAPAFPEPVSVEVREMHVENGVLVGMLALRNVSHRPVRVVGLDWSARALGVRVEGEELSAVLPADGALDLSLRRPLGPEGLSATPSSSLPASVQVVGTVYLQSGLAGATSRTFGVTAPLTATLP